MTTVSGPAAKPDRQTHPGPIHLAQAALLCAGVVFLVALVLYSWTLAPTVTLVDSGELIVVARFLGVAHPPGFPLWVILAHLATLLPFGSVALRINFSSAVFGALAAAMLTLVVAELMIIASYLKVSEPWQRKKGPRQGKRGAPDAKEVETGHNRLLTLAPALGAGLLVAFSRTLWSYATIAEVYSLNTLLILLVFFLMLRWRRRIVADRKRMSTAATGGYVPPVTTHDAFLYAAAVVFGLALGVHHVTVALMLPAIGIIVYKTEGLSFYASRRLFYAALFSFAALFAIYSYLPLAASRMPVISWGNPRSLEEIWWHVTGRQYQVFFTFNPQAMGGQFLEFGRMAFREFGVPWIPLTLVLAIAGFGSVFKQDRATFWVLSLMVIADLAYALSYTIAEDKDAYYLPAFIAIAIGAGFGLRWLIQLGLSTAFLAKNAYGAAGLPVVLAVSIALIGNWPFDNRRHYFIATDYVENLLRSVEPNGLLLTFDWQVVSPMLYAQGIEQRRRDVKVVDINLLRRSWYFDYLKHTYPGLIERSRNKVEAFVEELKQWEHDPAAYANDRALTERISSRFAEMIQSFVMRENEVAPVYVTYDFLSPGDRDREVIQWITKSYQLIPEGLAFKLASDRSFHDPRKVLLETRGLKDGTFRFERDDVVMLKVFPAYATMLVNQGRYLASFNRQERAIDAFQQALALDPSLELARQGLEESTRKLRNP